MKIDRRYPPCWSAAKDGLYWREWAAAKRADKYADRHELHIKALGKDKSHVDFTNNDFTKVLGVFRAISRPDDLISQLDAGNGRKKRLIFGIRRTAQKLRVGEAYIEGIIEHMTTPKRPANVDAWQQERQTSEHPHRKLDDLNEEELEKVRIAMSLQFRRVMAAKKKELQAA